MLNIFRNSLAALLLLWLPVALVADMGWLSLIGLKFRLWWSNYMN